MHATDVTKMMVGQRERRIPLDGVNAFVRSAHEFETGNKIVQTLTKRYAKAVSHIKIIGLAHSEDPQHVKEHKYASEAWIDRAIAWRTRFTAACDAKRQDVANAFPFMPKMPVYRHVEPLGGSASQSRARPSRARERRDDSDMEDGSEEDEMMEEVGEGSVEGHAEQNDPRDKFGYVEGVVTLELFQVIYHSLMQLPDQSSQAICGAGPVN